MDILFFLNTYLFGPALPIAVFAVGLFLSVKLGFFHIIHPKTVMCGIKNAKRDGVSPIKATTLALAGTLGVGNIAGVTAAISVGGAGAVFWMWISALFAMILKYSETVLALKHRRVIVENGRKRNTGGAFVYMADTGHGVLAIVFAILCVITSVSMGSIVQANAVAVSLNVGFGLPVHVGGVLLSLLTFIVICGGFERISDFTLYAVPFFCLIYTLISLYVIVMNLGKIPDVIARIICEAFSFRSLGAGVFGSLGARAVRFGVARGILSNEAGSGTSVTAHAASNAEFAHEQGLFGIFEVFVDTILLCSATAFVILLSGVSGGDDAMETAICAYGKFIGGFAPGFMSVSVVFFAFATIMCWSVYGVEAIRFIICEHTRKVSFERARLLYRIVYSASVFAGCVISAEVMWEISDLSTALMTIINTAFLASSSHEIVLASEPVLKAADKRIKQGTSEYN